MKTSQYFKKGSISRPQHIEKNSARYTSGCLVQFKLHMRRSFAQTDVHTLFCEAEFTPSFSLENMCICLLVFVFVGCLTLFGLPFGSNERLSFVRCSLNVRWVFFGFSFGSLSTEWAWHLGGARGRVNHSPGILVRMFLEV